MQTAREDFLAGSLYFLVMMGTSLVMSGHNISDASWPPRTACFVAALPFTQVVSLLWARDVTTRLAEVPVGPLPLGLGLCHVHGCVRWLPEREWHGPMVAGLAGAFGGHA